jgi:outer membrane protein assembly factor BamD (BamD/ComL family)
VRLARPEQPSKSQGKTIYKDETSLMAKLRDLGSTDLELSLKLAREGNERYPSSPEAVERTWFVCKSLTGLGRSEEARAEALKMVEKYPGTSFTNDVQRHVIFAPQFEPPGR